MSNINIDIEQEFFEVFAIEKRHIILEDDYGQYRTRDKMYPEITAEILLKLICIAANTDYFMISDETGTLNEECLKGSILLTIMTYSRFHQDVKNEVKALFEEEEQCQK